MMWFDKNNPSVMFGDIRKEDHVLCDGRSLSINPDVQMDFTNMPFTNDSFSLVVFDPPHLERLGKTSWMAKKYGVLPGNWKLEIKKGFDECMRVLKNDGVLIFKWNEDQIKVQEVIKIFETKPLFGHPTGRHGKTIWLTFMKTNY